MACFDCFGFPPCPPGNNTGAALVRKTTGVMHLVPDAAIVHYDVVNHSTTTKIVRARLAFYSSPAAFSQTPLSPIGFSPVRTATLGPGQFTELEFLVTPADVPAGTTHYELQVEFVNGDRGVVGNEFVFTGAVAAGGTFVDALTVLDHAFRTVPTFNINDPF